MEKKILFIQKDSPFSAECIKFFKAAEWEVEQCVSGAIGMEKIASWEPDVICVGQEVTGFNPFFVLKNISSVILPTSQLLLFIADEDFLKKIERDHEKWEGTGAHIIRIPVAYEKLHDYCKNWNTETFSVKQEEILYHFPKTAITENKKKEARKEPVQKAEDKSAPSDSNEIKTLKQYVALKEKELSELQADFSRTQEQLRESEALRERQAKDAKSREQEVQTKADKLLLAERKCEMAEKKYEELKERVKKDIQQIRVHEKELEARLEILKRDSETLLAAKDRKLLEFKRKIDSLEYEMESLIEKEKAAHKKVEVLKERMNRVLRALKLGTSLLESDEDLEQEVSKATEASQTTQSSLPPKKSTKAA